MELRVCEQAPLFQDSIWPYFGRLWRGLLSLLNIADIICARYCHFRQSLGRRERDTTASLLQGRAACVAARTFAWEKSIQTQVCRRFDEDTRAIRASRPPQKNEKTQLG